MTSLKSETMGKLINRIPGSCLLISIARHASRCQQAFSKPCLVNLISKDTHLVFSIYSYAFLLNSAIVVQTSDSMTTLGYICASTRQNLSSGFLTKRVLNQSPQLQRLARQLKFHLKHVYIWFFSKNVLQMC